MTFTPEALRQLRGYTREAGVRNLEREIAASPQGRGRQRAEGRGADLITPEVVTEILGRPRFQYDEVRRAHAVPGVATGLAWTPAGGDILFIEATRMPGKGT